MSETLKLIDPIQTAPADFPRSEEVPEGCVVMDDLKDEFAYQVDLHKVIYAKRQISKDGHAGEQELCMYIYEPKAPPAPGPGPMEEPKFPAIVFVQGSAFHKQWMFDHIGHHVRMAQRGYVVCAVEYRPSELAPFPAQAQDCKTAVRYMKKNAGLYHCNPEHFALWGDSSGGHTVLMAGFTGDGEPDTELYRDYSAKVNCIVDWYGPTDFSKMNCYPSSQNHIDPESPEGFEIGRKNVLENPELTAAAVPMNYLSGEKPTPPTLIMHGGRDMLVPFNQSCRLYNRMKELGKDVTFIKLNNANHGFLGFNCTKALDLVDDFLRKHI